jgi:hypothetical protein
LKLGFTLKILDIIDLIRFIDQILMPKNVNKWSEFEADFDSAKDLACSESLKTLIDIDNILGEVIGGAKISMQWEILIYEDQVKRKSSRLYFFT